MLVLLVCLCSVVVILPVRVCVNCVAETKYVCTQFLGVIQNEFCVSHVVPCLVLQVAIKIIDKTQLNPGSLQKVGHPVL